jgi:hypothetical protein
MTIWASKRKQSQAFTFVTALFDLHTFEARTGTKATEDYLAFAAPLLNSGARFCCFCQPQLRSRIEAILAGERHNIYIVETSEIDLRFNTDRFFRAALPMARTAAKDTHRYLMLGLQKVHWMREAAEQNHFATKYFCWIDIGINHVTRLGQPELAQLLAGMGPPDNDRVICGLLPGGRPERLDIHHFINGFGSFIPGGILAANKPAMDWLASRQDQIVLELLDTHNVVTWEAVVWAMIAHERPERFSYYEANWNETLLTNFPRSAMERQYPPYSLRQLMSVLWR